MENLYLCALIAAIFIAAVPFGVSAARRSLRQKVGWKAFNAIISELEKLQEELNRLPRTKEPMLDLVKWFNITSRFHDKNLIEIVKRIDDPARTRQSVSAVAFIENVGRTTSGWNRTRPGEEATPDNVFLGDIFGLNTKTISFWLSRKDDKPRFNWPWEGRSTNAYEVVSEQALDYMQKNEAALARHIELLYKYYENNQRSAQLSLKVA